MYGILDEKDIFKKVKAVCDVYGRGKNGTADIFILGVIATETGFGLYKDRTEFKAGSGLCQIDKIAFDDVIARCRPKHRGLAKTCFGFNLSKVSYNMIEYDALLNILFCRLYLLLKTEEIGCTIEELASYYKRYYNTSEGKGSKEKFIGDFNFFVLKPMAYRKNTQTGLYEYKEAPNVK